MARPMTVLVGSAVAVGLMVAAMWAWFDLPDRAVGAQRADVLMWAAKSLAIAAAAGAQIILITFVIGRLYRFKSVHDALRLTAALVCCIAAIAAAALGLAAQQ